jgi:outer membrane protein TolC
LRLSLSILFIAQICSAEMAFRPALQEIINRDTDLSQQRAVYEQTRAQRLSNYADFLPTISAVGIDQQYQYTVFLPRTQQALLSARINLFRSGADLAGWRGANAAVQREESQLRQKELDAEQNAVSALVQYIQAARQAKVAENLLRLNQQLYDTEGQRYRRGLVSNQELQKSLVEKNNSAARLQDARAKHAQAKAQLLKALGQDSIEDRWPWQTFLEPARAEKWIARNLNLENSPAWRAAVSNVEAQDQIGRSRFRQFLPSVDFVFDYGYQNRLMLNQPGWDAALTVTIPLFDLKKYSDYQVQVQQRAVSEVSQEALKRSLAAQWQDIGQRLGLALQSAQEREESVKLAQSLYQDNQNRLRAGRSSLNDVVVDQNRLADAETLAINGWADAHLLYAQLCHVLGLHMNQDAFGCSQ